MSQPLSDFLAVVSRLRKVKCGDEILHSDHNDLVDCCNNAYLVFKDLYRSIDDLYSRISSIQAPSVPLTPVSGIDWFKVLDTLLNIYPDIKDLVLSGLRFPENWYFLSGNYIEMDIVGPLSCGVLDFCKATRLEDGYGGLSPYIKEKAQKPELLLFLLRDSWEIGTNSSVSPTILWISGVIVPELLSQPQSDIIIIEHIFNVSNTQLGPTGGYYEYDALSLVVKQDNHLYLRYEHVAVQTDPYTLETTNESRTVRFEKDAGVCPCGSPISINLIQSLKVGQYYGNPPVYMALLDKNYNVLAAITDEDYSNAGVSYPVNYQGTKLYGYIPNILNIKFDYIVKMIIGQVVSTAA